MVEAEVQLRIDDAVVVAPLLVDGLPDASPRTVTGVPGRRRTLSRPTSSTRTLSTHALPVFAHRARRSRSVTLSYHRLLKPQRTSRQSVVGGTRRVPRRQVALVGGAHVETERP